MYVHTCIHNIRIYITYTQCTYIHICMCVTIMYKCMCILTYVHRYVHTCVHVLSKYVLTVRILNFVVYKFSWILWYSYPRKFIHHENNTYNYCTYHVAMATKINTPQNFFAHPKTRKFNSRNLIRIW